jgi:two-component sensor histidine kinase
MVGAAFVARYSLNGVVGETGLPFLFFFPAIIGSAALFANGAGYLATATSLLGSAYFLPPVGSFTVLTGQAAISLSLYAFHGCITACVVETMHNALRGQRMALAERERAEADRLVLLDEFRHRSRNDLQSLVGLLLLRARRATPEAGEALREAAGHALALARVHSRLATASAAPGAQAAVVDTRAFILGLCSDMAAGAAGNGLRPVAIIAEAEAYPLSTERAVQLGLVLNETVTNALKYAFPLDRPGRVLVTFGREGDDFVLHVADDGIGLREPGSVCGAATICDAAGGCELAQPAKPEGLGTRLLRALAAQLRGTFTRGRGEGGRGTCCMLRFPAVEPGDG